jgi:hypothetical protein
MVAGLVVLLDRVTPEPVFDAGVIVIQSPEGLGCRSAMEPTVEDLSNGLGQADSSEKPYDTCWKKQGQDITPNDDSIETEIFELDILRQLS